MRSNVFLLVLPVLITALFVLHVVNASEQCYNFGNGHDVYPREIRTSSESFHRIHWSKAQSMSFLNGQFVLFVCLL